MTKITKFLLLLTFLTSWNSSFAQKDAFAQKDELLSLTKQLNPVEPSVAGIARYGVYPVNYSTGLPTIEIPIYTLKAGDVEIPIKLSYRGGGIPVAEEATWVGLGWDLFYGGSITRQVNGRPDDPGEMKEAPTSSDVTRDMDSNPALSNPYPLQLYEESGGSSNRRDVFYFNVNGSNGSFVYDSNGSPLQLSYGSYSVTRPLSGFNTPDFLIKSPDGTSYSFSGSDITELLPRQSSFPKFTSAWHLDKVLSANKCDSITYTYQSGGNLTESTFSCSEGLRVTFIEINPNSKVEEILGLKLARQCQNVATCKPKYIITPNEMVEFVLDDRNDIHYVPTNFSTTSKPKKLRAIIVKEKLNGEYKQKKIYNFFYSYFTSGNGITTLDLKLKLDSVTLITREGKQLVAAFDYYGNDFCPSKDSYSADYWGFYNEAVNTTPIPRTAIQNSKYQKMLGGANLSAVEEKTKIGSLRSIIYPTGGSSTFDWEANRCDTFVGNAMEMKCVGVSTCGSPLLLCSNKPSPDPSVEIDYQCEGPSVSFKCNKSESVEVSYRLGKTDTEDFQHNKYDRGTVLMTVRCPDGSNSTLIEHNILNGIQYSEVIGLHEGCEYTLWAFNNCKNISGCIGLTYNSYSPNGTQNQKNYVTGGLRVKSIENFDCNHQLLTKKRFTYLVPNTRYSSGKLHNTQQKHYTALHETIRPIEFSSDPLISTNQHIQEFYVYSKPTSGAYSNSVNYQYVQVYDVDSQNHDIGYTEYEFATCEDEHVSDSAPDISMGWNRGQTLKETAYRLELGTPVKVQEIENYYSVDKRINRSVRCLDVSKGIDILQNGAGEEQFTIHNVYRVLNYFYEQNWKHLDSTVTTNFLGNNKQVMKTAYAYENYKYTFPSRTTTLIDRSRFNEYITKYPHDYIDGLAHLQVGNDAFIPVAKEMVSRNMINPVEVLKKANGRLVGADLYWYENSSKFGPQMKKKFSLKTSSDTIKAEKDIVYASNPKFEIKYNGTTGRIEEAKNQNGIVNSFLWGYNSQHPVASVLNASRSRIAYDNFEAIPNVTSSSFWGNSWFCSQCLVNVSGGHTGINCIEPQDASVKTISTIPFGNYRISFWAKQKNGTSGGTVAITASSKTFSVDKDWKYNEDTINLKSDQQVLITSKSGVLLDDMRLHPVDAQMTTYTWNNTNAITSAIDSKGLSTLYEYDEFGRLQLQKDHHLKIQQHYDYQYGFTVLDTKSTSLSFSGSGGTQGMPITSNATWSASSNCSWITATPTENEGSSTLNISCSANQGSPRTGTITLKSTSYGSITRTITVSQASIPSYLNVEKANFLFEYLGGNQSITVSSSHPWSVSTIKGAFITATKVDEQTLRIKCWEYSGGPIYRKGSVTISNGVQNVTINISQGTDPTKYPQPY